MTTFDVTTATGPMWDAAHILEQAVKNMPTEYQDQSDFAKKLADDIRKLSRRMEARQTYMKEVAAAEKPL